MNTSALQLDPDAVKRALAITLGNQPQQLPSQYAPQMAAPGPIATSGQQTPDMSITPQGAPKPQVQAPRGTLPAEEAERSRLLSTGSGESQISSRIKGSDFGQNHPKIAGVLGPLAQGAATLGDIGLSAVAPQLAINLPGTEYHHQMLVNRENKQIGDITGEQEKQAQTAKAQADVPYEQAQTKNLPIVASERAGEQGMKVDANGNLVPQAPEEQSPGFKTEQKYKEAQIYGLENPWAKLPGNEPVGNVDQLNKGMGDRYQVLHPGAQTPTEFQLPANATKNDFDRIDKLLTAEETASGNQQNREQSNQIREAMLALAMQNAQNRESTQGDKWAYGQDKDGNTIAGPISQLKGMGAQNIADIPTMEVRQITNARQAVRLAEKQGTPQHPETMGVEQLIDSLGKDGQLGVAASRVNAFLAGGVGAEPGDDPRIMALLDKTDLLMTATMLAHFGASGGRSPQMLEHFLQMANAKKMNENTLKAGVLAITDYMKDRAMEPGVQQQQAAPPAAGTPPPGAKIITAKDL